MMAKGLNTNEGQRDVKRSMDWEFEWLEERKRAVEPVAWPSIHIRTDVGSIRPEMEEQQHEEYCSFVQQFVACVERKLPVHVVATNVSNRNHVVAILSGIDPFHRVDAIVYR